MDVCLILLFTFSNIFNGHCWSQPAIQDLHSLRSLHCVSSCARFVTALVNVLTSIEGLCQLHPHISIFRGVSLQRHRDKQRGVRGFWRKAVWWNCSAGNLRAILVLSVQQSRARRHRTTGSPGDNVPLKPRKQVQTPVSWHRCESLLTRLLAPSAGYVQNVCYCRSMVFIRFKYVDYITPETSSCTRGRSTLFLLTRGTGPVAI